MAPLTSGDVFSCETKVKSFTDKLDRMLAIFNDVSDGKSANINQKKNFSQLKAEISLLYVDAVSMTAPALTSETEEPPTLVDLFVDLKHRSVYCPNPGQILYGSYRNSPGNSATSQRFSVGQSVIYYCYPGFYLSGNSWVTCTSSGSWSIRPTCTRNTRTPKVKSEETVSCRIPEQKPNSRLITSVRRDEILAPRKTLTYVCDEGYKTIDPLMISCTGHGRWSSPPPNCNKITTTLIAVHTACPNPAVSHNSRIEYIIPFDPRRRGQGFPAGSEVGFACISGFEIDGTNPIICRTNGQWASNSPTCRRISPVYGCPTPTVDSNVEMEVIPHNDPRRSGQGFRIGSQVSFKCKPGYELDDDTSISCHGYGQWTKEPPTCRRKSRGACSDPGSIEHAGLSVYGNYRHPPSSQHQIPKEYPVGSVVKYECAPLYRLEGEAKLHCGRNGWSSKKPRCIEACGESPLKVGGKVTFGSNTTAGEFPWMVSIFMNETRRKCGGALLDHKTVLSAAHCFVDVDNCTLYFGKYNGTEGVDDKEVVTKTSTEIIIHPEFDKQTFDNDIAIVKFYPGVTYTDRIHPICMPTTSSTAINVVRGEKGYIAGWGLNEKQVESSKLMLAHIPVQESKTCTDAYLGRRLPIRITRGMYCAGFTDYNINNEIINVCKGDSGSPMVFYNQSTKAFVLEGLVSHGTKGNCDLPARYSIFTRVSHYLDWIYENMDTRK